MAAPTAIPPGTVGYFTFDWTANLAAETTTGGADSVASATVTSSSSLITVGSAVIQGNKVLTPITVSGSATAGTLVLLDCAIVTALGVQNADQVQVLIGWRQSPTS